MLWDANVASVQHRYPTCKRDDLPGVIGERYEFRGPLPCWNLRHDLVAGAVLKACDCYSYQSCERDDWEASEAHAFIDSLRNAAWRSLPSYETAPWGFPEPMSANVRRIV